MDSPSTKLKISAWLLLAIIGSFLFAEIDITYAYQGLEVMWIFFVGICVYQIVSLSVVDKK